MARKKGGKGQKKPQGAKSKSVLQAKRHAKTQLKASKKGKKAQSKAVKSKLKKLAFNKDKKIEQINANINKVLLAPAKLSPSTTVVKKPSPDVDGDSAMPDVSGLSSMMSNMS